MEKWATGYSSRKTCRSIKNLIMSWRFCESVVLPGEPGQKAEVINISVRFYHVSFDMNITEICLNFAFTMDDIFCLENYNMKIYNSLIL